MAKYLTDELELQSVADAIRAKGGTSASLAFPSGFVSAIEGIEAGGGSGDHSAEDGIVDGTISTYSNSNITTLKRFAFADCYDLKEVNLPNVSYINQSAFCQCQTLSTIELPSCEYIGDYAFDSCYNLFTASFPAATYIGQRAFRQCSNLYSLYLLGSSMASISTHNVFTGTPISTSTASGYGSIYVPASLISVYRGDGEWSYFRSRFVDV